MATTKTMAGFGLRCPDCGADGAITIDLNDLGEEVICRECDNSFSVQEAAERTAEQARRWAAVARWIDMAPSAMGPG